MGQSVHDAVHVPFMLPAGVSNEGQFAFSVESIVQPTKMKGTLTYMVKVCRLINCKFFQTFSSAAVKFREKFLTIWVLDNDLSKSTISDLVFKGINILHEVVSTC
jgi:hypothetical protein